MAFSDELHELYKQVISPREKQNATAADKYENLARTVVPSILVCATTSTCDGSEATPFLMVVAMPTSYRKGHMRSKIWAGAKPAILAPGNVLGHEKTAFVVMGSLAQNTRDINTMPKADRSPDGYILRDMVICLGDGGSLFTSVVASSQTAPGVRNTAFAEKHTLLRDVTWTSADAMDDIMNDDDVWASGSSTVGEGTCVRLAKFIPLPCPCPLPPGIIGDATIGPAGLRVLCEHFFGTDELSWLYEPLLQEWLTAVAATPSSFATKWLARAWISESITEENGSPRFHSAAEQDLWAQTERTLAFRLHLD